MTGNPLERVIFTERRAFLGAGLARDLLDLAVSLREKMAPADVGYGARNRIDREVRQSLILGSLSTVFPNLEDHVRLALPAIAAEIGMAGFRPGPIECHLLAYGDGGFFVRHSDTMLGADRPTDPRKISGVYLFHRLPKAYRGGELRLHPIQGADYRDIAPENDHLIIFPSFMPHEVLPVSVPSGDIANSRFSVAIFIH